MKKTSEPTAPLPEAPLIEHAGRANVAKRLGRMAGHATSLKRMWDEGVECKEMLTQIAAVRAALDQVGKVVLEHHIDHCVAEAIESGRPEEAVRDLKGALDRFV